MVQYAASVAQLSHYVVKKVVIIKFVDFDNVGMVQTRQQLHLQKELFLYLLGHLLLLQYFNGPLLVGLFADSPVYVSERSLADFLFKIIILGYWLF